MTGWSSCLPACPPPTVPAKLTLLVTAREMQPKSVSTEAQDDGLSGNTWGFVRLKPPLEICWIERPSSFTSTPSFFVYLRRSGELWVVGAKWRTYVSHGLGLWRTKNKILGTQVCDSQTQITNLCLCNTNTNLILGTLHFWFEIAYIHTCYPTFWRARRFLVFFVGIHNSLLLRAIRNIEFLCRQ